MENVSCNVIYVDRSVSRDRSVRAGEQNSDRWAAEWESPHVAQNVGLLLEVFDEVYLCGSGGACLSQWLSLQETSLVAHKPTLFLLDTPYQEHFAEPSRSRPPSPVSVTAGDPADQEEDLYGLALLRRIISESYIRNTSKLVVTVPIVAFPSGDPLGGDYGAGDVGDKISKLRLDPSDHRRAANTRMLKRCLDFGATDVMTNPINGKCVTNLEVHAYRAHRDAVRDQKAIAELRQGRKRSWVGISEEKPFAYLREAMVSKLMNWICRIGSETEDGLGSIRLSISLEKQAEISSAVRHWHFSAHSFTDDELVVAASVMFKHALSMPELEPWRIPTDQLYRFLLACRAAYNGFVPYHNFRHVVDVLQATFHFLVCIGSLPPYHSPDGVLSETHPKSPVAKLLQPFDALTLLITAIGHDVGHPGVNNGFLVTLNAPLAQLYNDRSVLESFHCAAYSQIPRRYWPAAFGDSKMRNLMISSILATDMGLHFDYMKKLAQLGDRLRSDSNTEAWSDAVKNEQRALACALLIKCADISNVARRHDTAFQWMHILSDEFSRQATMELELAIPTSLMSQPKKDIVSLATAQLKFMNVFAIPLFQGVAGILPAMQYCVDELYLNKDLFDRCLMEEQERQLPGHPGPRRVDSNLSSNSVVFAVHPEPATEAHPRRALGSVPRVVEPQIPPDRAAESLQSPRQRPASGRPVNGIITSFSPPVDFTNSDPFATDASRSQGNNSGQRCSEATEGSSAPHSGDWGSQATSATTGRMPLSPSTQGTSIVSKDSFERLNSVPATSTNSVTLDSSAPPPPPPPSMMVMMGSESAKSQPDFTLDSYAPDEDDSLRNGQVHGCLRKKASESDAAAAYKQLKKKPSRFRINNALHALFRKQKNPSPPMQAADSVG